MTIALLIAGLISVAYHVIAMVAAFVHKGAKSAATDAFSLPPRLDSEASLRLDDEFYAAIKSHAEQDYPEFEILFGVHSMDDAAVAVVRRLIAEFPAVSIRLIDAGNGAANGKVHILMRLAAKPGIPW